MHANHLPSSVDFSGRSLAVVDHEGQPWLSAADLAAALGYEDTSAVTRIHARHASEFTEAMSLTVKLTVKGFGNGKSQKDVRIFSPRGCHLIAMFARTPRAAEFRRWVLDVLEAMVRPPEPAPQRVEVLAPPPDMITEPAKELLASHLLALLDRFGATPQVIAELDRQGQLPPPRGFQQKLKGLRYQTRILAKESARLARVADDLSRGMAHGAQAPRKRSALADQAIEQIRGMLGD